MLKSNFFRSKNFNVFYDSAAEKSTESPLRFPTWPEKNPLKPVEIFLRHVDFPRCFVKQPIFALFLQKKEERTQCLRALSSSLYKYTTFFAEIQTALTFRNTAQLLKCSDLQQRASGGCYITRRFNESTIPNVSSALLPLPKRCPLPRRSD